MISQDDKNLILAIAKKYQIKSLFLFGSSAQPDTEANDIDIAVKGIAPFLFSDFMGSC